MTEPWQSTWSRRFVDRVAIQRPQPEPPRRRLTDEEIAALPESMRAAAYLVRSVNDAAEDLGRRVAEAWLPALREVPGDQP